MLLDAYLLLRFPRVSVQLVDTTLDGITLKLYLLFNLSWCWHRQSSLLCFRSRVDRATSHMSKDCVVHLGIDHPTTLGEVYGKESTISSERFSNQCIAHLMLIVLCRCSRLLRVRSFAIDYILLITVCEVV